MPKNPPPVSMSDLKTAIAAGNVITVWHRGEDIEVEPHALIQAQKTCALVLAACRPGEVSGKWIYLRFAEIRGLRVSGIQFARRLDIPLMAPQARLSFKRPNSLQYEPNA